MAGQTIAPLVRENVYLALFNKLKTASQFITTGRRAVTPDQIVKELCPALFVVEPKQIAQPKVRGLPTKWELIADVYIYVWSPSGGANEPIGQETVVPATQINAILDSFEATIKPDEALGLDAKQTLGGLVEHCWIEGDVVMDEGLLFPMGAALVPIRMLVTS